MKTLRYAGALLLLLAMVAVTVSSCNSSRRLGCPMKITQTHTPLKPVC